MMGRPNRMMLAATLALSPCTAFAAGIEEILVTATKRPTSQQQVPVAVTGITADALSKKGITETTDLSGSVPNLVVSSPFGRAQPNFTIRGISVANEYNSNAASPIGMYVNEDYKQFRPTHGMQLFDLERLEVIRGPQGTLFGRNTTGGAISVTTVRPTPGAVGEASGFVSASYGSFDRKSLNGAIETSLIEDVLAVRLAGTWNEGDGYIENKTPSEIPSFLSNLAAVNPALAPFAGTTVPVQSVHDEDYASVDDHALRLTVVFEPTENFDATLVYLQGENDSTAVTPVANMFTDFDGNPATPVTDKFGYSREQFGLGELDNAANGAGYFTTEVDDVTLTMNYLINSNLTITSNTGFLDGEYGMQNDCDGMPHSACYQNLTSEFEQFNQDLRISWEGDRSRFIAGIYYGDDSITETDDKEFFSPLNELAAIGAVPAFNAPVEGYIGEAFASGGTSGFIFAPGDLAAIGAGTLALSDAVNAAANGFFVDTGYTQDRESQAIYFEGSYDLTDNLTATVGLRYTEDEFELSGLYSYLSDLNTDTPQINVIPYSNPYQPGLTLGALEGSSEEVTGRAILNYRFANDVMGFVSYSRGYRSGTFNGAANFATSQATFVEPEFIDSFEAGIKSQIFDNTMQLNATVFYADYQDQQVQEVIGATTFLRNASGTLQGLELELEWVPLASLYVSAGLGYTDSEYDGGQYFASNTNPGTVVCSAGPSTPNFAGNCIDIEGNQFPFAPELNGNLFVEWTALSTSSGDLALSLTARYQSEIFFDSFNDDKTSQLPGSFLSQDAYTIVDGRISYTNDVYTVALWGKNLGDKSFNSYGIDTGGSFGYDYHIPGQPRTYGIDLNYKF